MSEIRSVRVADPDRPGDMLSITVRWLCAIPTCRRPRGEPTLVRLAYSYADRTVLNHMRIHRWTNPCGHLDLMTNMIKEAEEYKNDMARSAKPERPIGTVGRVGTKQESGFRRRDR